jgi:hypothetical protein
MVDVLLALILKGVTHVSEQVLPISPVYTKARTWGREDGIALL